MQLALDILDGSYLKKDVMIHVSKGKSVRRPLVPLFLLLACTRCFKLVNSDCRCLGSSGSCFHEEGRLGSVKEGEGQRSEPEGRKGRRKTGGKSISRSSERGGYLLYGK